MKKELNIFSIVVASSLGLILTGCGTSPVQQTQSQQQEVYRQQARVAKQAISEAPEWMYKLPKESGVIYENGTAISSDFSMADLKAKTMAYVKICTGAGGNVRSQMKMYRADNDTASVENSELTVRSLCPDVDISGVETVEMKHVAEGNRIRSYVLVALPLGSKNVAKSAKETENRSGEAFKELDGITQERLQATPRQVGKGASNELTVEAPSGVLVTPIESVLVPPTTGHYQPMVDGALSGGGTPNQKINVRPATKLDGSMLNSVKAVTPDSVVVQSANGHEKKFGLVASKNPEYIARRAEALNKPGAVIGQVSIE